MLNKERREGCGRGQPSTKIVHNVWLPLGALEPRRVGAMSRVVINAGRMREAQFVEASEQTTLRDARTSWSACQYHLTGYHKVLHKEVLPHEWSYLNASLPKKKSNSEKHFCMETYEWAKSIYDPVSNPLHALAMVISLIFVGMLPRVFPPTNLPQDTDMRSLATKLANMSWEERTKKGVSHAGPFMTMVSTFVIAMMDNSSPLMQCLLGDNAGSRIDEVRDFFSKHSEPRSASHDHLHLTDRSPPQQLRRAYPYPTFSSGSVSPSPSPPKWENPPNGFTMRGPSIRMMYARCGHRCASASFRTRNTDRTMWPSSWQASTPPNTYSHREQ